MENHFTKLGELPWLLLFITHVRILRNGRYANENIEPI